LANPAHVYLLAGSRNVTLVVTDPHGDQVRVIHAIVVA
jgi:PKD repeat protein